MKYRLAALALCASATGCKPGATTLALSIDAASSVRVESLALHLVLGGDGDAGVSEALPPSGEAPALPGRAVVRLPDVAMDVAVALDGEADDGTALHAETTTRTVPHEQVAVSLTLGMPIVGGEMDLGNADLATPVDAGQPCVLGARCNYAYHRQLTIHNNAAAALPTGYTVRVLLDPTMFPASKTRADLNDVRVFGDPPADEFPRVIDLAPPGQGRALWLALQKPIPAGASDTSYSIYYGFPNATAPPANPALVFPFYDGFDNGTTLSAFWLTSGAPTVGGGLLTLHRNATDAVTTTAATDTMPTLSALEWRSRISDAASAGQVTTNGTFWWWAGYQRSGDFMPQDPWIVWIQRSAADLHGEQKVTGSANCASGCNGGTVTPDNAFHWYRIERDPAVTRFFVDGAFSTPPINDNNSVDYSVMFRNWAVTSDMTVDWVRGRALASPEPGAGLGPELTQ